MCTTKRSKIEALIYDENKNLSSDLDQFLDG